MLADRMRTLLVFALVLTCSANLFAQKARIIFVRHAETQANATGRYNSRTIDAFSDLGKKQVFRLTGELDSMRFDPILVSPSERALRTIAPYLRSHRRKAIIWPELYECCDAHTKAVKGTASLSVRYGSRLVVPSDIRDLFVVQPGHDRLPNAPSYVDGLNQIRACAARLRSEFGTSEKQVLVVGHSLMGGRLLELLEGKPMVGKIRPANTSLTAVPLR